MNVAVLTAGIGADRLPRQPWMQCRETLAAHDVQLHVYDRRTMADAFKRPFDAMLLHVWQDWLNPTRFDAALVMPILEGQIAYRDRFPATRQIAHHHADENRHPLCLLTWQPDDWVLYRTPPYDRESLRPLRSDRIWAYEQVWGAPRFVSHARPRWAAGFIGTPTGPRGYRTRVARATRAVGLGICAGGGGRRWRRPIPSRLYDAALARCRILVCPRGWGPQSTRHWDAWRSGKPVLTDRACAATEMIPGIRLEPDIHYLVYDEPEEIPDIVADWTRPSRSDDLEALAARGRDAALSYDPCARILAFFEQVRRGAA